MTDIAVPLPARTRSASHQLLRVDSVRAVADALPLTPYRHRAEHRHEVTRALRKKMPLDNAARSRSTWVWASTSSTTPVQLEA
jgi:hypothetical protein